MKNLLTVACVAIAASLTHAQVAPTALPRVAPTVDQILSLKRAGSPEISPDGRSSRTRCAKPTGTTTRTRPKSGCGRRHRRNPPADHGKKSSMSPAWSPDGSRLAFISDRTDKRQLT